MRRFRPQSWILKLASVGFFCASCALFLSVVFKAFATNLTYPNPTPNPFYFSEVAPGDSTPEVVPPASGPGNTVSGNNGFHYNVWVPNTSITLTRIGSGGADSIGVSSINTSPAIGVNTGLLTGGSQDLNIGATRDAVPSNAAAGTYTGAYVISVRYTNNGSNVVARTRQFRVRVLRSITIDKTEDLRFGETYDSDGTRTVNATDADSGSGTNEQGPARFDITGSRNHSYDITLPSSVTMTTGDGIGATKQIVVNSFTSNPSSSGTISGAGGTTTMSVGATRAAPISSQVSGTYNGSFTVTVYYY